LILRWYRPERDSVPPDGVSSHHWRMFSKESPVQQVVFGLYEHMPSRFGAGLDVVLPPTKDETAQIELGPDTCKATGLAETVALGLIGIVAAAGVVAAVVAAAGVVAAVVAAAGVVAAVVAAAGVVAAVVAAAGVVAAATVWALLGLLYVFVRPASVCLTWPEKFPERDLVG
jgi:hypothetical protein